MTIEEPSKATHLNEVDAAARNVGSHLEKGISVMRLQQPMRVLRRCQDMATGWYLRRNSRGDQSAMRGRSESSMKATRCFSTEAAIRSSLKQSEAIRSDQKQIRSDQKRPKGPSLYLKTADVFSEGRRARVRDGRTQHRSLAVDEAGEQRHHLSRPPHRLPRVTLSLSLVKSNQMTIRGPSVTTQ